MSTRDNSYYERPSAIVAENELPNITTNLPSFKADWNHGRKYKLDTGNSNILQCSVCRGKSHGRHFGAISCRACAAFFRRTIAENLIFVCRLNNRCTIVSGRMKACCRACRLLRCYESGMIREEAEHWIQVFNSRANKNLKAINSPNYSGAADDRNKESLSLSFPTLSKIVECYENFVNEQTELVKKLNGDSTAQNISWRTPTKEMSVKVDHMSYHLLHKMLIRCLPQYAKLDFKISTKVFASIRTHLLMIHRCQLTLAHFPTKGDPRYAMDCGHVFEDETLKELMKNLQAKHGLMDNAKKITFDRKVQVFPQLRQISEKFKDTKADIIDFSVLMILTVLNEVQRMGYDSESEDAHKFAILRDWHKYLINKWGLNNAGFYMCQILCHLTDLYIVLPELYQPPDISRMVLNECTE
ncbi:zinc finger, c4 type (two domains) domain-containing protein [Ditylenchus destructor]|nr:zinc finger, c4 type (two domains) domain-containing protein [Ditylenchus destructor]